VRAGDEVIVLTPATIPMAAVLAGARVARPLALPDFRIDYERLAAAINPRTRLLIVNTPLNPAGSILDAADWDRIADLLEPHYVYLLSDEVYDSLVFDGRRHVGALSNRRLRSRAFSVFSFGKTYATGWKVGYCLAAPR
jgi:methionine aminotransferase